MKREMTWFFFVGLVAGYMAKNFVRCVDTSLCEFGDLECSSFIM